MKLLDTVARLIMIVPGAAGLTLTTRVKVALDVNGECVAIISDFETEIVPVCPSKHVREMFGEA